MPDKDSPTKRYLRLSGTITRDAEPGSRPTLLQLIPEHWVRDLDAKAVWMRGYRMLRVSPSAFGLGSPYVDLGVVRVMVFPGAVTYSAMADPSVMVPADNHLHFEVEWIGDKTTLGPCLVLMTPFDDNEAVVIQTLDKVAGILVAFEGLNIAHERLFDNIHTLDGSMTDVWCGSIQSPLWLPAPDISHPRLNLIHRVALAIERLPEPDRNRVHTSLQWLYRACRLSRSEAFLSYWIAIESLIMKGHGDLASIKQAIERIYDLTAPEAGERFLVGRLYDVRGRIVHKGQLLSISGELLEFVEALYTDLLLDKIGLPPERRAGRVLHSSAVPLQALLP